MVSASHRFARCLFAGSLSAYRYLEKQFHVLGVHLRAQQLSLDLSQRVQQGSDDWVDSQWPDDPVPSSTHTVRGMMQLCVDFHFPASSPADVRENIVQVVPPTLPQAQGTRSDFVARNGIYALKHLPGFFFAPGALSLAQQEYWCQQALVRFIERPNRRNLDVDEGMKASRAAAAAASSTDGAAPAAKSHPKDMWKTYENWFHALADSEKGVLCFETPRSGEAVDDVSWATLGWQYDWGTRKYLMPPQGGEDTTTSAASSGAASHFVPMPEDMRAFGRQAAQAVGESLEAQAGIVNYYKLTASMGGHQDIAEQTYDHPVIGLSVGCGGVFLMGGETKDSAPLPILLRSGDVLFMGGVTRLCYHGVACMLPGTAPPLLFAQPAEEGAAADEDGPSDAQVRQRSALQHWVRHHRLNMNVRQVLDCKVG